MKNLRDVNLSVLAASLLRSVSQWVRARLLRSTRNWTTQSRRQPSGIRSACSCVRREMLAMMAVSDTCASGPKCESSQKAFLNRDDDTYTCDHCYSLDSLLARIHDVDFDAVTQSPSLRKILALPQPVSLGPAHLGFCFLFFLFFVCPPVWCR